MRHWRHSFVTRLGALFAALIVAVVLGAGWLRDRARQADMLKDQRRQLTHRAELIRVRVQSTIDSARQDILYLSRIPAVQRVASAQDEAQRSEAWRQAAVYLRELLEVRPAYFQARVIGIRDQGREVIRFDRIDNQIRQAPDQELQRKGDRDYFRETLALAPGQVYLSEINLNQEFGQVSEPHIPTLRVSMPIRDAQGTLFGLAVLNFDVRELFQQVRSLAGPGLEVVLCNSQGDYLLHSDPAKCFGLDLGHSANFFADHPGFKSRATDGQVIEVAETLSVVAQFPLASLASRVLILQIALPNWPLHEHASAARLQHLAVTLGLAAAAAAAVLLATSLLARRLSDLARAVDRYEPGGPLPEMSAKQRDEVGVLAGKFRAMAEKIGEQMTALQQARERAEAATRAREEFMETMSHEIRTPMNAVLGIARLLDETRDPGEQADRLKTLRFAGRHLMALLNNLLDRDRIESGDFSLEAVPFDLADLLENLRQSLEPLAAQKGLALQLELGGEEPWRVVSDPVRLFQVLTNLTHNAIKFTERGHVRVQVTRGDGGMVTFEIQDTGPGLPAALAAWLNHSACSSGGLNQARTPASGVTAKGDPPVSLESQPGCARHPAPPGLEVTQDQARPSGLGLRISQRLIQLLGARLHLNSGPRGTHLSFALRLPNADQASRLSKRALDAPPELSDYDALVIEDVPSNRIILESLVAKTGMRVDHASTTVDARGKAATKHYDFAFLDLQLPDGSGLALAGELRRVQPQLRILAVSAQVSREARAACQEAGVRAFIAKPIEPSELYAKLRDLTSPKLESVSRLMDGQQAKIAEYFRQLQREWHAWEAEVRALLDHADAERLGRLHHRMKNSLRQLELWKLDRSLDQWRQAMARPEPDDGRGSGQLALRLLSAARPWSWASAPDTVSSPEQSS